MPQPTPKKKGREKGREGEGGCVTSRKRTCNLRNAFPSLGFTIAIV